MVGIPADEAAEGGELASRFLRHRRRVVPSPCKAGTECLIIGELLKLSVKGAPPLPHSGHISSSPPGNSSPPLRPKNEVWIICWAVTGLVPPTGGLQEARASASVRLRLPANNRP